VLRALKHSFFALLVHLRRGDSGVLTMRALPVSLMGRSATWLALGLHRCDPGVHCLLCSVSL
jgi:hypothetical protein